VTREEKIKTSFYFLSDTATAGHIMIRKKKHIGRADRYI
jgi:hypothetical protein